MDKLDWFYYILFGFALPAAYYGWHILPALVCCALCTYMATETVVNQRWEEKTNGR